MDRKAQANIQWDIWFLSQQWNLKVLIFLPQNCLKRVRVGLSDLYAETQTVVVAQGSQYITMSTERTGLLCHHWMAGEEFHTMMNYYLSKYPTQILSSHCHLSQLDPHKHSGVVWQEQGGCCLKKKLCNQVIGHKKLREGRIKTVPHAMTCWKSSVRGFKTSWGVAQGKHTGESEGAAQWKGPDWFWSAIHIIGAVSCLTCITESQYNKRSSKSSHLET